MGAFAAGEVVVLPFPFSDLAGEKYRPALLLADAGRGDWIASQITSNPFADPRAVELLDDDFARGGLRRISYARPGKLFTASETLFASTAGKLRDESLSRVRDSVIALLSGKAA